MHKQGPAAFTLVEILVAITIIGLLAALLLPMVASAGDKSKRQETAVLFDTLAGAIERFKDDTGSYPLPTGDETTPYPSASIRSWYPTADEGWSGQRLWWRLAVSPTGDTRAAGKAEAQTYWEAADPIAANPSWQAYWTARSFRLPSNDEIEALDAALDVAISDDDAEEFKMCSDEAWSSNALIPNFSGNAPNYRGLTKIELAKVRGIRARRDALRAWTTAGILGLADVAERFRDGQCIVDSWGTPIGYIHDADPALPGQQFKASNGTLMVRYVHLPDRHRATLLDRDGDGDVTEADMLQPPLDEEKVDRNGDGSVSNLDWASWQSVAMPGFEKGYLLISAGTDGLHHALATEAVNRDDMYYRGGGE